MKKVLLSILAASAVLVGCQNYDDQFDALNTQITALKTQVDGLAGVQSQVTELKNLINSLASATANQDGELAALNTALAGLSEDVSDLDTALGEVADSVDLTTIESEVEGLNAEVEELLELNQIFTGTLTIKTEGQLSAALEYGNKVRIVNGSVDIEVSTQMNRDSVQVVVDRIRTITGDLDYVSEAATISETTFDQIIGVSNIYVKQSGGVSFSNLGSALNVTLDDAYESKVAHVNFPALESVSAFVTKSGTALATNTIEMTNATNIDLGELEKYTNATLTIKMKKGESSVLDIASLEDKDALDAQTDYSLSITGPNDVNLSLITDGTITLEDVKNATVNNFEGSFDINEGVLNFTAGTLTSANFVGATDIERVIVSDAKKKTATSSAPGFSFDNTHGDLEHLELDGTTGAVSVDGAGNVTTVILAGTHSTLTLNNLGDLVTVTVDEATIGNVTVTNNSDLLTLDLAHTSKAATGDKGVTVNVSDNNDMTTLSIGCDAISNLTIQGNAKLDRLNMSATSIGATGAKATVKIGGVGEMNNLTATKITNKYEATAAATAADTNGGSIDGGTSNMKSLVDYLTAAKTSPSTAGVQVYFDKADLHVQKNATGVADTETQNVVMSATTSNLLVVMDFSAEETSGTKVRQSNTQVFAPVVNALNAQVVDLGTSEGIRIVAGGITKDYLYDSAAGRTTLATLVDFIDGDTTFGSDFSVAAAQDSYKETRARITYTDSGGSTETTAASGTIYYTFGVASGTVSIGTGSDSTDIATAIAADISGTTKYRASASGSDITVREQVSSSTDADLLYGSSAFPDLDFVIDAAEASTTAKLFSTSVTNTVGRNSDFFLNASTTDATGIRITVTNESTALNRTATISVQSGGTAISTTNAALASGTNFKGNKALVAAFSDIENVTVTKAASTKNRTGWFN